MKWFSHESLEAHKINGDQQNIVQKENERQSEDTKKVHDRNKAEKIYVDEEEKEKKEKDNDNDKSNKKKEDKDTEDEGMSEVIKKYHFDASV